MATQSEVAKCPHCAAGLPAKDIAEGWCDSCGKRLPSTIQQQVKKAGPARAAAADSPEAAPKTRILLVGTAVALLFGLALALIVWKAS